MPTEEFDMFLQLLEREGFDLSKMINGGRDWNTWDVFLFACSFHMDYYNFAQRMVHVKEAGTPFLESLAIHLASFEENTYDFQKYLFFGKQLFFEYEQIDCSLDDLNEKIQDKMKEHRLNAFQMDLNGIREGGKYSIAIDDVDNMDPFNFELLLK